MFSHLVYLQVISISFASIKDRKILHKFKMKVFRQVKKKFFFFFFLPNTTLHLYLMISFVLYFFSEHNYKENGVSSLSDLLTLQL